MEIEGSHWHQGYAYTTAMLGNRGQTQENFRQMEEGDRSLRSMLVPFETLIAKKNVSFTLFLLTVLQ